MQSFFGVHRPISVGVANDLRRYFIVRSVYPASRLGRTGDTWARERTSDVPGLEPGPHSIFYDACLRVFTDLYLDHAKILSIELDSGLRGRYI